MGSQEVSNFRRRRKENLIRLAGGKCVLCGYDKCFGALEFHHINPEEKKYALSSGGNCHKIEDDVTEVKKCILVCSNCHREIHLGMYDEINLFDYQQINEEVEKELIKEEKSHKCKECGAPITTHSRSGLCVSCAQTLRYRHRVSDLPNRETLKNLIRITPFTKIGEQYNVTDNAVRKWCDKYNLPRTKKEIEKYNDDQWEKI